jgi:glucose/arabinose dehydrogenase
MKPRLIALVVLAAVPAVVFAAQAQRPPAPPPNMTPGQPIESRPPELEGDKPAFAGQTRIGYRKTVAPKVTVVTDKLSMPWSLAFLPDGRMLVTEKGGTMRIVTAAGVVGAPLTGVPAVVQQGQVGLLDVVLDRDFRTNQRIFFSFAEAGAEGTFHIALASARLNAQSNALSDVKVVFKALPDLTRMQSANSGGRIAVGRDGNLFMTVGDRSRSPPWDMAQKLDTHLGKIIHVTADGRPAPGNPFVGRAGALPEIYSLGHRSEEGLTVAADGQLWETEHGPRGGDELNRIEAGKNYGWPVIVHGIDYPGDKINGGKTEQAGMEQGRYYWDPVIAPSGLAIYNGAMFPEWRGNALVGALRGQALHRLTLQGDKVVDEEPLLVDQKSRIRDVRVGADGAVWVLTDEGKLLKLTR